MIAGARSKGTVSTYGVNEILVAFGDSRVQEGQLRCLSAVISRAISSLERKGFVKEHKLTAEGMKIGTRMSICLREGSEEVDITTLSEEEQRIVLRGE